MLGHSSGEWIAFELSAPIPQADRMNPVQALGSVITYLRRYSLLALLGLAADDDDGNMGQAETARREPARQIKAPQGPRQSPPAPTSAEPPAETKPASADGSAVISPQAHRRLEAMLGEAGIPRERIKAWAARTWRNAFASPDAVHLAELSQVQAQEIERRIPEFAKAIQAEADKAARIAEAQAKALESALQEARDAYRWDGTDLDYLAEVATTLDERATAASQSAAYADGAGDADELRRADAMAARARLLRAHVAERRQEAQP
jgi:hypothetical protein